MRFACLLLLAAACSQTLDGDVFRAPEDAAPAVIPRSDAGTVAPDAGGEMETCVPDCDDRCGNGACGPAEDACGCPEDCQPTCGERRCCGDDLCCVTEIGECGDDCAGGACDEACSDAREVCRGACHGDDDCKEECDDREETCRAECDQG